MRLPRASRFFLAFYTLFSIVHADSQCAIEPNSIVSDACTSYSALESLHKDISPALQELTQETDFFAYYRLNLYNKVCPFWSDENSMCGNRACAVDTIDDEKDIPLIWRAEELSKLEGARAEHPKPSVQKKRPAQRPLGNQLGENVDESCVYEADDECDERDYCVPEDEGAAAKGDYVSLVNNTERFTGYSGPGARQVWDAIYRENCFDSESTNRIANTPLQGLQAANEIRSVFHEAAQQHAAVSGASTQDNLALDDECIEQRAFYRIISGMHASISTHLCWDYFNQTTGEWVRNIQCYKDRLHTHPERISNLYFNYALVSRAIAKLGKHLQSYTFCSGDPDQDFETKMKTVELSGQIAAAPHTFDESIMFRDPEMLDLKDDFKQRFRNVSRIMDCVGCDKCRLWGKVQTAGYGAALKVLFEFDETKNGENPPLRRTELVALINTLGRLGHSLEAVQKFRKAVNTGDMKFLETEEGLKIAVEDPISVESGADSGSYDDTWKPKAATTSSSASQYNNDDDEDDDYDEEDFDDFDLNTIKQRRRSQYEQQTIMEVFKSEFGLVWRTYKMVLNSWMSLPFKLSAIVIMELNRLWNFWLGLPVPPRSWEIRIPTRDEL